MENNKLIKNCIIDLLNTISYSEDFNIKKYNELTNIIYNLSHNKNLLSIKQKDFIIRIKLLGNIDIEIFYDDDYDYSKITYRKVNNVNILETTYFSGCKDFYIVKNKIINTINIIELYKKYENIKNKKINQCIAICKTLQKNEFKRPFNLTEDIMNCY